MPKWTELRDKPIVNLIKLLLVFLLTGVLFYWALRTAGLLMPFVLALLCAMMMEPAIRLLCKIHVKNHYLPRSIASILALLVMGTILSLGLVLLINRLISQFASLMQMLPRWIATLSEKLPLLAEWLEGEIQILPEDLVKNLTDEISTLLSTLVRQLTTIAPPFARRVWTTALKLPTAVLAVIMFLIGTFYMCSWRPRIAAYMKKALPEEWMHRLEQVKQRLFSTLFGYLRAQLLILVAVFTIIFVGLTILRVEYALIAALVIALFDALPVLGSGLFLNTWAAIMLAMGNIPIALGLFLTYIAVLAGRNILEPRLVSVQIGLPPLLTMVAMYAGFRLFGFLGVVGGPVLMVVLRITYEYYAHGRTLRELLEGRKPVSTQNE